MAKVAVIVPLYNKGAHIARAMDSIVAQTYQDLEVIVVDDGSTDDGPEIVARYEDPRIRMVRQENAGAGAARNRGVDLSGAPLLAFLDADDEWLPGFLQVCIDALDRNRDCDVCITSHYEGPKREDVTSVLEELGLRSGVWSLPLDANIAALESGRAPMFTVALVCRRTAFVRCGGFYDQLRVSCGEDTYLWLQFIVNCRIAMVLEPLAWYHSEESGLALLRKDPQVLQPYLYDAVTLLRSCPEVHRSLLQKYLTMRADLRLSELCLAGDSASARRLLHALPSLRRPLPNYLKRWLKTQCPFCYRAYVRVRRRTLQ
jgi:glycosyltransferase involved in cell wall biosynthesis